MQTKFKVCFTGLLFSILLSVAHAERLYVTDRILLGVHSEAKKDSLLVNSVPSGTSLEILGNENGFKKVKLPDGTEGWVDAAFLVSEQPAPAQYDILLSQHERIKADLDKLNEKYKKVQSEIQVRRDQLSNAKTTIQELKKNKGAAIKTTNPEPVNTAELDAAKEEVKKLTQQLVELKASQQMAKKTDEQEQGAVIAVEELATLRARIELAMQNLKGEEILTLDDISSIRPSMPGWFWGLIILVLVLGVAGGILFMDFRNRKRHGGFRV